MGAAKLEEAHHLWQKAQRCFEAIFGPEEATQLRRSLASISSAGFTKALQEADTEER
jgi:hypothetical protein